MIVLIFFAAAALGTSAPATDSGHCESKPFTLKKPAVPAPKPAVVPAPKAAQPKPAATKTAKANKSYVPGCKQPKG